MPAVSNVGCVQLLRRRLLKGTSLTDVAPMLAPQPVGGAPLRVTQPSSNFMELAQYDWSLSSPSSPLEQKQTHTATRRRTSPTSSSTTHLAVDKGALAALTTSSQLSALADITATDDANDGGSSIELSVPELSHLGYNVSVNSVLSMLLHREGGVHDSTTTTTTSLTGIHSTVLLGTIKSLLYCDTSSYTPTALNAAMQRAIAALAGRVWELDKPLLRHTLDVVFYSLVVTTNTPSKSTWEDTRTIEAATTLVWTLLYSLRLHGGKQHVLSLCWIAHCLLNSTCRPTKQSVGVAQVVLSEAIVKGHVDDLATVALVSDLRRMASIRPLWVDSNLISSPLDPSSRATSKSVSLWRAFKLDRVSRVLLHAAVLPSSSPSLPITTLQDVFINGIQPPPLPSPITSAPTSCLIGELLARNAFWGCIGADGVTSAPLRHLSAVIDEVVSRCISPAHTTTVAHLFETANTLYCATGPGMFPPSLPFGLRSIDEEVTRQLGTSIPQAGIDVWCKHERGVKLLQAVEKVPTSVPTTPVPSLALEAKIPISSAVVPPTPAKTAKAPSPLVKRPVLLQSAVRVVSTSLQSPAPHHHHHHHHVHPSSAEDDLQWARMQSNTLPSALSSISPQRVVLWSQCRVDSDPLSDLLLSGTWGSSDTTTTPTTPGKGSKHRDGNRKWLAGYRTHRRRFATTASLEEKGRASLLMLAEGTMSTHDMTDCNLRPVPPSLPPHPPQGILESRAASTPPGELLKAESNHSVYVSFNMYQPPTVTGMVSRFPWFALRQPTATTNPIPSKSQQPNDRHWLYRAPPASKVALHLQMLTAAFLRFKGVSAVDEGEVTESVLTCLTHIRGLHPTSTTATFMATATHLKDATSSMAHLVKWLATVGFGDEGSGILEGALRRHILPDITTRGIQKQQDVRVHGVKRDPSPSSGDGADTLSPGDVLGQICVGKQWARSLFAVVWCVAACTARILTLLDSSTTPVLKQLAQTLRHDLGRIIDSILTPLPQPPYVVSRSKVGHTGSGGGLVPRPTPSLLLRRMHVALGVAPSKQLLSWRDFIQAACGTTLSTTRDDRTDLYNIVKKTASDYQSALEFCMDTLPESYECNVNVLEKVAVDHCKHLTTGSMRTNNSLLAPTPQVSSSSSLSTNPLAAASTIVGLPQGTMPAFFSYNIYSSFAPAPTVVGTGLEMLHEALHPYIHHTALAVGQPTSTPHTSTGNHIKGDEEEEEDGGGVLRGSTVLHVVGAVPSFPVYSYPDHSVATPHIRRWAETQPDPNPHCYL